MLWGKHFFIDSLCSCCLQFILNLHYVVYEFHFICISSFIKLMRAFWTKIRRWTFITFTTYWLKNSINVFRIDFIIKTFVNYYPVVNGNNEFVPANQQRQGNSVFERLGFVGSRLSIIDTFGLRREEIKDTVK